MTGGNELPRRLAFLVPTMSGGMARHVPALADGCAAAGATVWALGPAGTRELFGPEVRFAVVPIGDQPRPARDAAAIMALRRQLNAIRPDVVHAHGVRAGAFAALALGRRTALVVTVHNGPPPGGRAGRAVYRLLERLCARRAGVVLCASADLAARMRAAGANAEQFDVPAPAAEPPSAADVARAAADIDAGGRPVVLAVGRLAPQKGFDVLVEAAARWQAGPVPPRTVIAGSGPLAEQLAGQARQAGADVRLLGERADVPALLAVADVFVLPSRWEARALVLQEAMQAGRAIVATSSGGTAGLVGADAAVLVPPGDAAALAGAVSAVLADRGLATRLGLAARTRAAELPSQQDAVRRALAVYRRLTGNVG